MTDVHSPSKILSVRAGDQIWLVHQWKKRGIVAITAHVVHDDHVKFGTKFLKLGKDFFLDEREAKTFVYEAARRSLAGLDASYKRGRAKLSNLISEMQAQA